MLAGLRSLFKKPEPAGPPETLHTFGAADRPIAEDAVSLDDGGWRIDVREKGSVRLFEVREPGVESCVLAYRAQMRSEGVEGGAYLEMWCRLGSRGDFFSKGLHDKLRGTTGWASYEIPFFLEKGQSPNLVKLNVAFEGSGTIWIRDVELVKTPLA